jgi:hypothetical protein
MAEKTRDDFITVKMAEGFSKEIAGRMYDSTVDPQIAAAQEQKVPTRGEIIEGIYTARLNNPDRKSLYKPDFSFSKEYLALKDEVDKAVKARDKKLSDMILAQMIKIKLNGTITEEQRQAEIDKTLEMPIAAILKERKKYEAIVTECEHKLNTFDISEVQAKVDALSAKYETQAKGAGQIARATLWEAYNKAVKDLEDKLITIPMNDIKIKRHNAKEWYLIYEARVKYYVAANQDLIEEEIENAKREEVRGSLVELAEALEREKDKKAALLGEG